MDKQKAYQQVNQMVADCHRCPLYKTATNPVPGQGNLLAKVFFIGEAPGFNEDQQGIPFCGRAGKLLDELLALANLKREEVFIANMLKHRPPNNRDPQEEEIAACRPFLDRQLEIVRPRIIVTLGRFSMAKFLPEVLISQVHGQPRFANYKDQEYIIFPMYHPAASLRNGRIKEQEEKDFVSLGQFLEKLSASGKEKLVTKSANKTDSQMRLI